MQCKYSLTLSSKRYSPFGNHPSNYPLITGSDSQNSNPSPFTVRCYLALSLLHEIDLELSKVLLVEKEKKGAIVVKIHVPHYSWSMVAMNSCQDGKRYLQPRLGALP